MKIDYRLRKQIVIGTILAAIILLVGFWIYFSAFHQGATCFDNNQNQKEEGVDCGGPCEISCERATLKDIQTEWVEVIRLKTGVYDLAAKVQNPNPNYGLSRFYYTFKLLDVNDALVKEQAGDSFILPGQTKYLIAGSVPASEGVVRAELVIKSPTKTDWQKLNQQYQQPDIYVFDKQFSFLEGQTALARAAGTVKNSSHFDFDRIYVSIILFGSQKQVLGVNQTQVWTVLSGEERYFSALWFTPINEPVAFFDIMAETNPLVVDNFLIRFGEAEKFQAQGASPAP